MNDQDVIIEHVAAGTLLELFVEQQRGHGTDELGKAFQATLAGLHNNGTIDVLEPARQVVQSPINQHDFFTVMLFYTELIPSLDASAADMLAAVKALSTRAGEDLASGMPNGAFRTWAEKGSRARDTLEAINPEDGDDSAYIFLALQALAYAEPDAAIDRALLYLGGNAGPARSASAKAIGTIDLSDIGRRTRAVEALRTNAASADDNSLGRVDKRDSQTPHVLIQGCFLRSSHGSWGLVGCGVGVDRAAAAA